MQGLHRPRETPPGAVRWCRGLQLLVAEGSGGLDGEVSEPPTCAMTVHRIDAVRVFALGAANGGVRTCGPDRAWPIVGVPLMKISLVPEAVSGALGAAVLRPPTSGGLR